MADEAAPYRTYPGAVAPQRRRDLLVHGLRLAVHEWGDPLDPPLLLAHGGFDFARTYETFAPLLAGGGWRVVAWDQRSHGDSERAALTSWDADVRDAAAVLADLGPGAHPVVGHSKGGGLMLRLAGAWPHRISSLVNIDGLPSRRPMPDVAATERTRMLAGELASWLDHRRRIADGQRKPGTLEELAERRRPMNPRLPLDWLRHLVTTGAFEEEDGWRWKVDPALRFGGFGPWRPEWSLHQLPGLPMPVLGVIGTEQEPMGWGTSPADAATWMPRGGHLEVVEGAGHFVHVEQPRAVAELVLEHLGAPPRRRGGGAPAAPATGAAPPPASADPGGSAAGTIQWLRHGRVRLALHHLRAGEGRPLLLLHGLGGRTPDEVPTWAAGWPGPVAGLDVTGHGASSTPAGAGYSGEVLLGDVDAALAALGEASVAGEGLGGWLALLAAGGRPQQVRGAAILDGPGLEGGGPWPPSASIREASDSAATPDPWALVELTTDVRPPDYAGSFARLATHLSGLATPLWVVAKVRPPWLQAVLEEPGVAEADLDGALAALAGGTGR